MRRSLFLLLALLPGMAMAAADGPRSYARVAPLTPAPGGEGLQSLALPWPVLQASRSAGLADVRLFDAKGQVLPMAWAAPPAASESTRRVDVPRFAWPVTTNVAQNKVQLRLGPDGAVLNIASPAPLPAPAEGAERWLLDLSALKLAEGERLSAVELDWPRRPDGLSTSVTAETSSDGQHWQEAAQAQILELNAEGQSLALKTISWPSQTTLPRYLRLRFGLPLKLTASRVLASRADAAAPLQALPVRFEPAGDAAAWQLDLQGPLALRALALRLPERNSVLNLRLEQRDKASEAWRPVHAFVAWRLQREGRESESAAVQLPPTAPARYWRLLTGTGGAHTPLEATLHWQPPQLVFLARGEGELTLAVGREKASSSAQPLASLIPGYRSGAEQSLPRASLGALSSQPEPGWQERLTNAAPEDQRRWLLWAVLVFAVAGLGALAWRLLRQIAPPQE